MPNFANPGNALRLVLRLNAGSSLLIGAAMAAAPAPLAVLCLTDPAATPGLDGAGWIRLVGIALLPFAGFVWWVAARTGESPALVRAICAMDWVWVLGSAILLAAGWTAFTWTGAVLVDLMAVAVAGFAVLQVRFLGAMRRRVVPAA